MRYMFMKNIAKLEAALASMPGAAQPTLVEGKWRAPAMSRRKVAELRKAAIALGKEWPWDVANKNPEYKPPKGHKHERDQGLREAKIEAALKKQPALIEAHKKHRREVRAGKDVTAFDQILMTTKEKILKSRQNPANQKRS